MEVSETFWLVILGLIFFGLPVFLVARLIVALLVRLGILRTTPVQTKKPETRHEQERKPAVSLEQVVCPRCRGHIDRPESCYCPQCGKILTPSPRPRLDGDFFFSELQERFGFEPDAPCGEHWGEGEIDWMKLGAALGSGAVLHREELRARFLGLLMLAGPVQHLRGCWLEDLVLPELEEGMLLGAAKEQLVEGSQLKDREELLGDLAPTLSYLGRFVVPVGDAENQEC